MARVYLGLGSNLGERNKHITTAVACLAERAGIILALSSLHESKAWGFESEHEFLNAALALETSSEPFELLRLTQQIEWDMGRRGKSDGSYHDRIIDIDILLYDEMILNTPQLCLPHPFMHERSFVMLPLAEIAPSLIHPVLKKTIRQLSLSL
ncbi:MAG: 2-amino-4-hydroxy-6-hydroxymethyldihydropteridine diphosphokinase [Tannerellaceae bacterium]|jgi:2-amino-4-hydroxy-6-hydroxymethyldihydropteridine diphosphokinase|nr:2-amino-4-hydroxy-6-hydroxymethyldihydropteridine diphosphokinase [Tannerellaceae bacterium]